MRTLKDLDIDFDDTNIYFNFDSKFQADSFIPYLEDIQSIYKFLGVNKKITYKTKEIDKDSYYQQVGGYMNYIKTITNKKVSGYIYSIIDGKYIEVKEK